LRVTPTPGSVSGRRVDRVGDPLDGLINLFDLALVLAVGLLLAALSSAGVVGLVAGGSGGTPIPGQPEGQQSQGQGTAVGTVYRLQDGSYVFSPSGTPNAGSTGATGGTTTPQGGLNQGTTPQGGATTPNGALPNGTGQVPQTGGNMAEPQGGGTPGGSGTLP
jgi:hypothetical protein